MKLLNLNNSVLADRWAITQAAQGRQTLPAMSSPTRWQHQQTSAMSRTWCPQFTPW